MWTYKLKQIGCLILATALLIGVGGCTYEYGSRGGDIDFRVDDTRYRLHFLVNLDRHKRIVSSSILVIPHVDLAQMHLFGPTGNMPRRSTPAARLRLDGVEMTTKTDTLYLIQKGKIVFEKRYRELGIDASRLSDDNVLVLEYLRPILEQMIREHIQPLEPEMEEEEEDHNDH